MVMVYLIFYDHIFICKQFLTVLTLKNRNKKSLIVVERMLKWLDRLFSSLNNPSFAIIEESMRELGKIPFEGALNEILRGQGHRVFDNWIRLVESYNASYSKSMTEERELVSKGYIWRSDRYRQYIRSSHFSFLENYRTIEVHSFNHIGSGMKFDYGGIQSSARYHEFDGVGIQFYGDAISNSGILLLRYGDGFRRIQIYGMKQLDFSMKYTVAKDMTSVLFISPSIKNAEIVHVYSLNPLHLRLSLSKAIQSIEIEEVLNYRGSTVLNITTDRLDEVSVINVHKMNLFSLDRSTGKVMIDRIYRQPHYPYLTEDDSTDEGGLTIRIEKTKTMELSMNEVKRIRSQYLDSISFYEVKEWISCLNYIFYVEFYKKSNTNITLSTTRYHYESQLVCFKVNRSNRIVHKSSIVIDSGPSFASYNDNYNRKIISTFSYLQCFVISIIQNQKDGSLMLLLYKRLRFHFIWKQYKSIDAFRMAMMIERRHSSIEFDEFTNRLNIIQKKESDKTHVYITILL